MKGATQDGCRRQVNLSTAEQRHVGQDEAEGPFHSDELAGFLLEQNLHLGCLTLFTFR